MNFATCTGTNSTPPPISYYYMHIQWTNNTPGHIASPLLFWTDNAGHQQLDPSMFAPVPPGNYMDFWTTNNAGNIGFVPSNFLFGDGRPGSTTPDQSGSVLTGTSSSSQSGSGTSNPGQINTTPGQTYAGSAQYGNTNVSSAQYAAGVSAIVQSGAATEFALRDIQGGTNGTLVNVQSNQTTQVVQLQQMTNALNWLLQSNGIGSAIGSGTTNALAQLKSTNTVITGQLNGATNLLAQGNSLLGTANGSLNSMNSSLSNLLSGSGEATNVNVLNQPTNYLNGIMTNLLGLQSSNSYLAMSGTNLLALASSNGLFGHAEAGYELGTSSNASWWQAGSNIGTFWGESNGLAGGVVGMSNGFGGNMDIRGGLQNGYNAIGSGLGVTPSAGFGLLALGDGTSIDLKPLLDGSVLANPWAGYGSPGSIWNGVPTVHSKIRLFLLWAILIALILDYWAEMRDAVIRVMSVPAIPVSQASLLGNQVGPLYTVPTRLLLAIFLVSMMVFLPSIAVASAATAFSLLPSVAGGVVGFVTGNGLDMLTAISPSFGMVYGLIDSWLPIHETAMFYLNWLIASWAIDATGVWLCAFKAGYGG